MAEFKLEAFPGRSLTVALFDNVRNSEKLRSLLQKGEIEPEVALLDAQLIPGSFPLLVAANKALCGASLGGTKSRTLHSELVFNYSASKHIKEGLSRCGIRSDSKAVVAARFDCTTEELATIRSLVDGEEVELSFLNSCAQQDKILKHFKIGKEELEVSTVEDAIASRIAVRDVL